MHQTERSTHVFASHLLLCELDLNERLSCGEELPPWPVLHATVLLDVSLDATDCQILNLNTHTERQSPKRHMYGETGVIFSVCTHRERVDICIILM